MLCAVSCYILPRYIDSLLYWLDVEVATNQHLNQQWPHLLMHTNIRHPIQVSYLLDIHNIFLWDLWEGLRRLFRQWSFNFVISIFKIIWIIFITRRMSPQLSYLPYLPREGEWWSVLMCWKMYQYSALVIATLYGISSKKRFRCTSIIFSSFVNHEIADSPSNVFEIQ